MCTVSVKAVFLHFITLFTANPIIEVERIQIMFSPQAHVSHWGAPPMLKQWLGNIQGVGCSVISLT